VKRREFIALSAAASATSTGASTHAESPLVSFGLVTDVQYADAKPEGERHFRASIPKLKEAAAALAGRKLPFTLHLGDVIDRDFGSFNTILPLFGGLGHPVRHLLGNHDFDVAAGEKPRVSKLLGMPADYYAFVESDVRFVMLDTNEVSTYKHADNSPDSQKARAVMEQLAATGASNAKPWNGGVSDAQLAWLDRQLAEAAAASQPVILCSHHPLLPEEGHHAWNHREILEVIKRHRCVRACLYGHNHAGNEVWHEHIPHITFKSLLHEPGVNSWAVLHLHRHQLVIEGSGREKSRVLVFPQA
jgi:hypothetical protein